MPQANRTLNFRGKCGSGLGPFVSTIELQQGYAYTAVVTGKGYSSQSKGYPSHAETRIVGGGRQIVVLAFLSACWGGKPYDVWFNISYSYGNWPPGESARMAAEQLEADETPVDVHVSNIAVRDFEFSVPIAPEGGRLVHEVQDVGLDLLGCEVVATRGPSGLCFQGELLGARGVRCTADWSGDPNMKQAEEARIYMRLFPANADAAG